MIPVIAIDGPSAAGKGTAARLVAAELGYHLLDSGALYRLLALQTLRRGIDDVQRAEDEVVELAANLDVRFTDEHGEIRAWLEGEDVSDQIRGEDVGKRASEVAGLPRVRQALLGLQRAFRKPPGLVADGRDMGTVVFPDAVAKIFVDASSMVRARRRYLELSGKGENVTITSLLRDIVARDARDRGREVAPLQAADDALVLITDDLDIESVRERIMRYVRHKLRYAGVSV